MKFVLLGISAALAVLLAPSPLLAAKLTLKLANGGDISMVGAFDRWDQDGNPRKKVNKDEALAGPEVDAKATRDGDKWVFKDLKPGRYDLVLMGKDKVRIEGFHYPPVKDFDPIFPGNATVEDETRDEVTEHITKSEHYENKVSILYMGGDKKMTRVLMQLIRDLPTSYEKGFGTMRYEVWQFTWNYGGWVKERRTKILHRFGVQVSDLRQWTFVWEPKLGGIEINAKPVEIEYEVPADLKQLKGLHPY